MRNVYDKPVVSPLAPVNPSRRPGAKDEDANRRDDRQREGDGPAADDDKRERMPDNHSTDGKGRFVDEFA